MRILIVSKEGDGTGIGQRLAFEGHNVDLYIADQTMQRVGVGLVHRIQDWRAAVRRADLILADCVGLGRYEDVIRASGRPAIGFSRAMDAVEIDRDKGIELFNRAGVKTPETHKFTSKVDALKLPAQHEWGDGWVIKASGNKANALTQVVKDQALWARAVGRLPDPSSGIVQRVVSGVEVSTEAWFNGSNFIKPFNHTFEEKRFLNGGLGETTGCQGNVVVRADGNKLTEQTVERVEPFLRMLGYRGPFDINCIVNKDGAYALEVTARFGYDAIDALLEGLDEPAGDFLFDVAIGTKKEMALTEDTMIAVRLSVAPWPVRRPSADAAGEPILGVNEETLRHLFLCAVEQKGAQYVTSGGDGVLLKATAVGSVTAPKLARHKHDYTYEARRRVYRLLDKIQVSNKQYRTDIGVRVNTDMAQLTDWGWL